MEKEMMPAGQDDLRGGPDETVISGLADVSFEFFSVFCCNLRHFK